jgi:hypothetical protein
MALADFTVFDIMHGLRVLRTRAARAFVAHSMPSSTAKPASLANSSHSHGERRTLPSNSFD